MVFRTQGTPSIKKIDILNSKMGTNEQGAILRAGDSYGV